MQALILVGGEGTRLRPLTSAMPKPVVPLVGQPFISYMLEWLHRHGVDDVILSCGFMAEGLRAVLGDGGALGVRLRYVEEEEPLGTGGALKLAEDLLDDRFFMLNGDVLTDIDLTDQLAQHERTGAAATLALIAVEDPSAYGLVRREADMSVRQFVEKPPPEEIDTNLVNAGAYILQREVLEQMPPAGTNFSIEREVFPALVGSGLYGYAADAYWLDIGTPERYLEATFAILEGTADTAVGGQLRRAGGILDAGAQVEGSVFAPALIGEDAVIAAEATIGPRTVLGRRVTVGARAHVEASVLLDGASVGEDAIVRDSILSPRAAIGRGCRLEDGVVLGEGVKVGADNVLTPGARIFPGVELPDRATSS